MYTITDCEENMIEFKIEDPENEVEWQIGKLSRNYTFFIPIRNECLLKNLSRHKTCRLFYVNFGKEQFA
jgi:hypothetical protein